MTVPMRDEPRPQPSAERAPVGEPGELLEHREIALVDLLDRLLAGGVVLTGDLTLAIADIDLVHISLRALVTSVRPPDDGQGG